MADLPTGTVTLFFTDVEGSTRLLEELGVEYDAALAEHHRIVRDALAERGGREVDTQGEAFFATFARATDAVAAATEVQRAFRNHRFAVRIGLHTGQPRVGETGYVGLDVPRAARICAAAHGGQVVVSETTRSLVGDEFELRDLGTHRLKDLTRPVRLFQLLAEGLDERFPPLRTLESRPTNLPIQPTPLIGRESELADVVALVRRAEVRLLTLTGPGGTGKTRLALQAAAELIEEFDGGVFTVSLEAIEDTSLVVPSIAETLGVSQTTSAPLLEALKEFLARRQLLLVVDNFERLVDGAPILQKLLLAAPAVKVLATSRVALHLSGEHEYPVPSLTLPQGNGPPDAATLARYESTALFVDRARAVRPDFRVTPENAAAVGEICVRLDGLPLAIELAAARIRILPPEAMLARLDRRLSLLVGGPRDVPSRQRTLRSALDWSYDLLDEDGRRLLARLSVFAGGCTLDAAEGVCDATLDGLQTLIDVNLLRQVEDVEGQPRFSLLETIREYAVERLTETAERDELQRRHAAYFWTWSERRLMERDVEGRLGGWSLEGAEHENVQAAMAWARSAGEGELELRLATTLHPHWFAKGHLSEGRRRISHALECAGAVEPLVRARALYAIASLSWPQGDAVATEEAGQEALRVFGAADDRRAQADVLVCLAAAAELRGDHEREIQLLEEAEALLREHGDDAPLNRILTNRAYAELCRCNDSVAYDLLREALRCTSLQRPHVLLNVGLAALRTRGPDEAALAFCEVLRLGSAATSEWLLYSLEGLASVAATRGDDETAARLWGASEAIRNMTSAVLAPAERATHEQLAPASRARLGAEAFAIAWAEGKAMPTSSAVDLALAYAESRSG